MKDKNCGMVLLSVHGIRTTGRWQKQLIEATDNAGITYRPLDFGYFMAISLLLPGARRKKIEWFRRECEEKLSGIHESVPVSIVAHSFGSYLLAGALRKYSDLKFDRIILCGSIVNRDYPWTSIITDRGQANAVLNEAGGKDFWAGIVSWVIADAGPSGVSGFLDIAGGRVVQRLHAEHRHSDYFYTTNYKKVWIPFLQGENVEAVKAVASPHVNWRFISTALAALLLLLAAFYFFSRRQPRLTTEHKIEESAPQATPPLAVSATAETDSQRADVSSSSKPIDKEDPTDFRPEVFNFERSNFLPGVCEPPDTTYTALYFAANHLMRSDPDIRIEVAGHTDAYERDQLTLSSCRAQRVYEYLRSRGISPRQMIVKGYKAEQPLDNNSTEEGRARNRRVEVNVRQ